MQPSSFPKTWCLIAFIISVFGTSITQAQTSLSGRVYDEKGAVVPFASIIIESLQRGAVANAQGYYELNDIPAGNLQVKVSALGYRQQSKSIMGTDGAMAVNFILVADVTQLSDVVVEGLSQAGEIKKQAYHVDVIDVKALKNQSADLNRILATSPGVNIREEGGLGSNFTFSLNGFSGNQIRFFLNGIPMENFGSSLTLNNIPVNVADRIEIYKGVVPVWLGADALGGAVNIVTNEYKQNYLDASYTYGAFNTHRSSIVAAVTNQRSGLTLRANLFQNYSDNAYKVQVNKRDGTKILPEQESVRRFHDAYDSKTAMMETGFVNKRFADLALLGLVLSANQKEIQTGATMEMVYGCRLRRSQTVMPTLKYQKDDLFMKGLQLNVFASYNFGYVQTIDTVARIYYWDGSYTEKSDPNDGELSRTRYKFSDHAMVANANVSYVMSERHSWVLNYNLNGLDREGFDPERPNLTANAEPKQLVKSVMGLGYKFDWYEKFSFNLFYKQYLQQGKTHYTINEHTTQDRIQRNLFQYYAGYGAAASYQITTPVSVKASFEKTYRLPVGDELFGDGANLKANPQLAPEQSQNFNVGGMVKLNVGPRSRLLIEHAYFLRNADNFIRPDVQGPVTVYINEEATQAWGMEGVVEYEFNNRIQVAGNITYQKIISKDRYYDDGREKPTYGEQIPNQPVMFANATMGYHTEGVKFSGDRLGVHYGVSLVERYYLKWKIFGDPDGKLTIPRQLAHNASVYYAWHQGRYNVSLECRNFLNARLYDNFKLQKPGRACYVKLRYFINKVSH